MTPIVEAARDAVKERLDSARDSLHDNVRDARRAVIKGREVVEDFAMNTALQVRRRPLASIAVAGAVGALAGCMVGLLLGWRAHAKNR